MGPRANGIDAIYRFIHPTEGFRYIFPAPPDNDGLPYRSDVLLTVMELLSRKDVRIVVLAGHDPEETRQFITEPLISFFDTEGIPARYIEGRSRPVETDLKKALSAEPPRVLMLDWSAQLAKDVNTAALLSAAFFTDEDRRLILVHHHGTAFPNELRLNGIFPFIDELPDGVRRSHIPMIGSLPQLMNSEQTSRYLFEEPTDTSHRIAELISTSIPLIHPLLKHVRNSLMIDPSKPPEDVVKRSIDRMATDDGVFVSAAGRVWHERAMPAAVSPSTAGYETFHIACHPAPVPMPIMGGSILANPGLTFGAFMNMNRISPIAPLPTFYV